MARCRRLPCCGTEANPHRLRDSPVAVHLMVDVPGVLLQQVSRVVDMPVVCNDRCRELQSAENCGFSAVAAHHRRSSTSLSYRRGRFPWSSTVQQTIEIPQLLLYKVVDVPVWQVLRVPRVQVVMLTVVIPQLQLVEKFAAFPDP